MYIEYIIQCTSSTLYNVNRVHYTMYVHRVHYTMYIKYIIQCMYIEYIIQCTSSRLNNVHQVHYTMYIKYIIQCTRWPKSNVPKVRACSSASYHLIRNIFSGVCRDIHWFEEYLKLSKSMIIFSNERSFYAFLTPITCLDHIPFGLFLFGLSRYEFTVKIRALACPVLEIYTVIDCVHHSLCGAL